MKTTPYPHQLKEFENHLTDKSRALFWYMRTGKSKAIIDQACQLYLQGEINTLLIIAPNGVHENWIDREIPKHIWDDVSYYTWIWDTKRKEESLHIAALNTICKSQNFRIFSFPSSTLIHPLAKKYVSQIIASSKGKTFVCFDEAHDFRTPGSKRTKWARAFSKRCKYKRILTGTPDFNSLLHYYSQMELLEPEALGFKRYSDFKAHFADYEMTNRGYPRLIGYKNIPELKERVMEYASVIRREDCPYLSTITKRRQIIGMTVRQTQAFEVLLAAAVKELKNVPKDDAFNLLRTLEKSYIKQQQIASGFIGGLDFDTAKYSVTNIVKPENNPKLRALLKEISYTTGQVIVWAQFQYDIRLIKKFLDEHSISSVVYYGKVSAVNKRAIRKAFDERKFQVFIGQPQSAGLGLDLSASSKIIWYSHTMDTIIRAQAIERATSAKNTNIEVVDFCAKPIDEILLNMLDTNISVSQYVSQTPIEELLAELSLNKKKPIGVSFNGRTSDFDSDNLGSIPSTPI